MEKEGEELGITAGVPTILIMGGSQGSSFLNRTATEAALGIAKKLKSDIQYIHLTGNADLDSVKIFYKNNGIRAAVHSFLDRIDLAYAAADVVVSRSGAAAVFELAYYGKAMILIPYPNPRNNQRTNAEYFERKGAALYREEKGLSADILTEDLLGLIRCDRKRRELGSSAKRLSRPDAAQALACRIIKIVSGKEKKKA
jgi:UDP-N-acetylglucosamine--N-acetylmuramyl-(pentapeptide) pyrophosphoryl-undecaprenol N-acetylglucosamine transferase